MKSEIEHHGLHNPAINKPVRRPNSILDKLENPATGRSARGGLRTHTVKNKISRLEF
jgi:hypothetical protein